MTKRTRFGLAFGLVAVLASALLAAGDKVPGQPGKAKGRADEPAGKSKRAQEFLEAFEKGDAKAVAGFWTPEGDFIDPSGRKYKGRAAIQKMYEKVFAAQKGAKLTVHVNSIRPIGTDVILEDGTTEVSTPEGGPPSVSAFSAVLVKKDGEWYFESVR